jgi:hypothetical protein
MDQTYRERHGEPIYRFKSVPSRRPGTACSRATSGCNIVLSLQVDAIGIRLRDVIGVDNMMWGSDYPYSESTFPRSRKILAGVLDDEDDRTARLAAKKPCSSAKLRRSMDELY